MSGAAPRVGTSRQILAVAVPAFAALVAEPVMLLADTAMIGHLGTAELAGLAVASVVLTTIAGLCVFLAYGTTAAVARSHGAGRATEAGSQAFGGVWLAAALGVVLGGLALVVAEPVSGALASSPEVADHASTYLRISAAGVPALLLALAATGALRGVLDLRTPLYATVSACVANVGLNAVLIYALGWGVGGAALGTVIAQWGAATWLVVTVVRRATADGVSPRPRLGPVLAAARAGVPLLLRTATLRVAVLLATAVAATFGDASLAAYQVTAIVVTFCAFALDAIAIAGQTLTGRALGAGDAALTRSLTAQMVRWGWGLGAVIGLVLAALTPWLPAAFTSDPAVVDVLVPALLAAAVVQPLSGAVFVLDGVLIGAGDGRYLAVAGAIALAAYAPFAVLAGATDAGLTWLWVAYAGFIAARWATLEHRRRGERWLVLG
ncbi:MATE family efflux transporter [Aeromicrobium sp. Leaf350]|uniref:MATE family efflux transporter n=1 Tax=Aeromicrobium sp. Leaf350 TaxID=2876565 RepID=UPI001E439ABF|nr:MATE family efflux transporter [Aeromicrobium sp. Leaf350]